MSLLSTNKFIFTWRIENFLYCYHVKGENFYSPEFKWQIDKRNWTTWRLSLKPRNANENYVECYLQLRESNVKNNVTAAFCLKVIDLDGHVLKELLADEKQYSTTKSWGYDEFVSRSHLTFNASSWIPKGTFVIQCEISAKFNICQSYTDISNRFRIESNEQEKFLDRCLACSKVEVDVLSKTYRGQINENNFTTFILCNKKYALLCMRVKLNAKEGKVIIQVKKINDLKSAFCTCEILIYDSSGNTQIFEEYQHFFSNPENVWSITFQPKNYDLFLNKSITLKSKFKISTSTEISQIEYGSCNKITFKDDHSLGIFKNSILLMYTEKKSCDFTIICADSLQLRAHKVILQARSPVFDKMLSFDSKELRESRVVVQDFNSKTLDLLLRYIYSSSPEDYETDVAMKVYAAADKYEMLDLKQHCSALMIGKLDLCNVFDVLKIADLYKDITLESFVKTSIVKHAVQVFESDEWRTLADENVMLASKVLKWVAIKVTQEVAQKPGD